MNTKTIKSKLDKINYIAVDKNDMDLDLIDNYSRAIQKSIKEIKRKEFNDERVAFDFIINCCDVIIDYCNGILERYS